jgi:hypothetical protein
VLLAVGAWLYWPGTVGPDLLDDRTSVMVGGDLVANPDEVVDFIFGDKSGLLGRSVSMTTFALEKLYLDQGMAGSKKVNIILHVVNAALFMLLCGQLFRFQQVRGYHWLAVLSGGLWLLHPLLVSSVLYVVQRMAMMSTFFMLLAALAYVRWRLAFMADKVAYPWALLVVAMLVLGMLAKENAIVIVPILLMLEVLWFRFEGHKGQPLTWLKFASLGLILLGAASLLAYYLLFYDSLAAAFHNRQFTLHERELTQLRILWDYIGQWFWPELGRMGLYHDDFPLSRSMCDPATTAWAFAAWVFVFVVCLVISRWRDGRLIAFGVAWFVLAHFVESTVLPLELYFEHRNYFPAMGLVLILAGFYVAMVRRWPETAPPLLVILGFGAVLVAGLASSQVQVWSNRQLLTLYHLNGHPDSFRANTDMAVELAELGEIEAAWRYSKKAHVGASLPAAKGETWGDYQLRDIALACIAGAHVPARQIEELGTVTPRRPFGTVNTLVTLVRMIQDGRCASIDTLHFADRMAAIFLVDDYQHLGKPRIFSSLAVLENALQRYDNAYAYTERYLSISPYSVKVLLMHLHFSTALGKQDEAERVIAQLRRMDAKGMISVADRKTLSLYTTD